MKVFLSYKQDTKPDHGVARSLEKELRREGFDVFRDESKFRGGDEWPKVILENLENCDVLVCLLSEASMQSRWVLNEVDGANERRKKVVPILLEELTPGLRFRAFGPRFMDCQYIPYDGDLRDLTDRLLASLRTDLTFSYAEVIKRVINESSVDGPLDVLTGLLYLLREFHVLPAMGGNPGYSDGLFAITQHDNRTLAESLAYVAKVSASMHGLNAKVYRDAGQEEYARRLEFACRTTSCLSQILFEFLGQWQEDITKYRQHMPGPTPESKNTED